MTEKSFGRSVSDLVLSGILAAISIAILAFALTGRLAVVDAQEPPTRHCNVVKFDNAGNFRVCDMPDGARCVVDDRGTPSCYLPK